MSQSKDYSQIIRVDEEIVAKLKELNEPDEEIPFFDGLIHLYCKEAPMALNKLDKAMNQQDPLAVVHFSHKLKGLSRNLGLRRMAEICATIEHGTKTLNTIEQRDLFETSRVELDQVIVALSQYLKPEAA